MRPAAAAATEAEAHQSRLFYELCALVLTILRSSPEGVRPLPRQVSAAGVASMLLGASMALMLCGSVTFMLGFFLMPWVVGLGCVFLVVGFVTNISGIGRAILLWPTAAASSSPKEASPYRLQEFVCSTVCLCFLQFCCLADEISLGSKRRHRLYQRKEEKEKEVMG